MDKTSSPTKTSKKSKKSKPTFDLERLRLFRGKHDRPPQDADGQVCFMEYVSVRHGGPYTDHPACVDPLFVEIGIRLNDNAADDDRQKALADEVWDTRGSAELTQRRARFMIEQLYTRVVAPFFRELPEKPRPDIAEQLERLPWSDAAELRRIGFASADKVLRVKLPALFRGLGKRPRPDLASRFEALAPIVDVPTANLARDLARQVRIDAYEESARKLWRAHIADIARDGEPRLRLDPIELDAAIERTARHSKPGPH
jgi:hypothetical protein